MKQRTSAYKIIVTVSILLFSRVTTYAQFDPVVDTLVGTYGSAVNWVDIDSDGDLDVTISGYYYLPTSARGKLYFNSGSAFNVSRNIRLMQDGDEAWCDFNRDGKPDMLYAGKYPTNAYSAGIDVFTIPGYTWSSLSSGFIPVINASVDWGDYDNDGDYDALISGEDASGLVLSRIYRNDNSVFSDINAGIPGVTDGKVTFIDYDLDKDLDIFISGLDVNKNKYTRLWNNNGGVFTITGDIFANLKFSQFDWGDFNSDGYPDLLLGGLGNTVQVGYIYLNNSGSSFTLSPIVVPGCYQGSSGFGDVDNDGDLDVFISGKKQDSGLDQKFIYINDGAGTLAPSGFLSTAVTSSFFQFGDWNKDKKLDFVVNGYPDATGVTCITNNNSSTANTEPSAPLNPTAEVNGRDVLLKWSHAIDNNTHKKALTYNIYIGTTPGGIDIVSPNADVTTGFRKISRQGYIQDTAWIIKNLPVGTYHWGVQGIDNALGASAFSAEGTFTVNDRFSLVTYTEDPSVSSPAIYFDADHDNDLDMFLNNNDVLYAVENTLVPFSEANYKTISPVGYNPIKTISPNDYNNDNKIDFTVSGYYMGTGVRDSSIALYDFNTPYNYDLVKEALIKNLDFEYTLWADLNNDGWQDIITSGMTTNLITGNKPATYIYNNLGNGSFEKVNKYIRGFEKCGAVEGDFDNDLDIDFVIYGKDSTGTANTYIYVNEGDFNFTETLIPGNQYYRAYLSYGIFTGDYDQNGELDIYMAGEDAASDFYTKVLLNHSMNFMDANLQIRSSPKMSNFWADYDYDGDLDIFSTSVNTTPTDKMRLYLNTDNNLEEVVIDLGAKQLIDLPLLAVNLDNDNGLDFLMKRNSVDYLFHQYYDNWGSDQRLSSAPDNLRFDQDKLDMILEWDKLPDCPACTYNIRVGTVSGGVDIVSPMSDLATGYRYVVGPGNSYLNRSWKLSDLSVGTYSWSVQAVDPSNTGGPWSPESTFTFSLIDADFSSTTVCLGDSTAFMDLTVASDPVTEWKWNFGDGSTSTLKNPKHLYATAGTFSTMLWAYTNVGDSASVSYDVQVKTVPVAGFSANIACQGTPTTFTNNTNINGLTILNWFWNFGDGQTSNLEEPGTHGYINPAEYQADLMVTADNGCSDFITQTVTVGSYPVAAVTANAPLTFCKGDSVTLSVPYNSSYTYNWMVGGVGLTGGDSSKYVAKLSGNYTVEVINPVGNCSDTSSIVIINAQDAPVALLISANRTPTFCEGDSVILSVTNTSGYTYQWKLNGGAIGTNLNQYTAKNTGTYNLVVTNSNGCSAASSDSVNVVVNSLPASTAVNLSGATTFCEGGSVTLSVTPAPGYTYNWRNEYGLISNANSAGYTAGSSGIYRLDISNSYGCVSRTSPVSVTVRPMPYKPVIASGNYRAGECMGDTPIRLNVDQEVAGYSYQWFRNGIPVSDATMAYLEDFLTEGDYSVEADLNGCTAESEILNVYFEDAPEKPYIYAQGPAVWYLACSNDSATRYRWYCNDILIDGAEDYFYVAGRRMGDYRVSIGNSKGCYTMSDAVTIPTGATGIDDVDPYEGLKIYPNPAKGLFIIEMNNEIFGDLIVKIITQDGKELFNFMFDKASVHFSAEFNLSGQPKGYYLIFFDINKQIAVRRIIID